MLPRAGVSWATPTPSRHKGASTNLGSLALRYELARKTSPRSFRPQSSLRNRLTPLRWYRVTGTALLRGGARDRCSQGGAFGGCWAMVAPGVAWFGRSSIHFLVSARSPIARLAQVCVAARQTRAGNSPGASRLVGPMNPRSKRSHTRILSDLGESTGPSASALTQRRQSGSARRLLLR